MSYTVITDSCANLSEEQIDELGLRIIPMRFYVDGIEYRSYVEGKKTDLRNFYEMMQQGKTITTSMPNLVEVEQLFRTELEAERDILYIGFSSALSGTFDTVAALMEGLKAEYPDRTILYVDTRGASLGEGLLVWYAMREVRQGATIEEVEQWVLDNRFHLAHWFTVDDLMYLFRGGRVTRSSAWAGNLLNVKPVLNMDNEGHLVPIDKVRGRKKSLLKMLEHMEQTAIEPVDTVFISHGLCENDLDFLVASIKEKWDVQHIFTNDLDPVIGAHCGPGTMALFFLAQHR